MVKKKDEIIIYSPPNTREAGLYSANIPHSVKIRLRRMGLSELGINQLSRGQIISDTKDRKIVSQIVAKALGG
jgi:hypothetical protein